MMLIIGKDKYKELQIAAIDMDVTFGYRVFTFEHLELMEIKTTSLPLIAYTNKHLISDEVKKLFYTL